MCPCGANSTHDKLARTELRAHMTKHPVRYMLLICVFMAACTPTQFNPERRSCQDKCVSSKNECTIDATTADTMAQCDTGFQSCMEPCSHLPKFVPYDS